MVKKSYFDLIELVEHQSRIIKEQGEIIVNLMNENAEQENLINVLMKGQI